MGFHRVKNSFVLGMLALSVSGSAFAKFDPRVFDLNQDMSVNSLLGKAIARNTNFFVNIPKDLHANPFINFHRVNNYAEPISKAQWAFIEKMAWAGEIKSLELKAPPAQFATTGETGYHVQKLPQRRDYPSSSAFKVAMKEELAKIKGIAARASNGSTPVLLSSIKVEVNNPNSDFMRKATRSIRAAQSVENGLSRVGGSFLAAAKASRDGTVSVFSRAGKYLGKYKSPLALIGVAGVSAYGGYLYGQLDNDLQKELDKKMIDDLKILEESAKSAAVEPVLEKKSEEPAIAPQAVTAPGRE